jgi:hypothetical protein
MGTRSFHFHRFQKLSATVYRLAFFMIYDLAQLLFIKRLCMEAYFLLRFTVIVNWINLTGGNQIPDFLVIMFRICDSFTSRNEVELFLPFVFG